MNFFHFSYFTGKPYRGEKKERKKEKAFESIWTKFTPSLTLLWSNFHIRNGYSPGSRSLQPLGVRMKGTAERLGRVPGAIWSLAWARGELADQSKTHNTLLSRAFIKPCASQLPENTKFPAHRLWDCTSYLGTSACSNQLLQFGGENACRISKEKQLR